MCHLSVRQCRARACHHITHPPLVHREHIHIALQYNTLITARDILFGKVETIELITLIIKFRGGAINVFSYILYLLQDTPTKAHHIATGAVNREDHPLPIAVNVIPLFSLHHQPKRLQHLQLHPTLLCPIHQIGPFARRVAKLKLFDHLIRQPTLPEVAEPNPASLRPLEYRIHKFISGKSIGIE